MAQRSRGREVALQLLFQREFNADVPRATLEEFASGQLHSAGLTAFALALFDGTVANLAALDQQIEHAARNWRIARMAAVDRNVLRLGAYELLHTPDTPPAVVINEAIELARAFGSKESPGFVNGVLDRLRQESAPPS